MAFASSLRKAQLPLKCQLCDEGVKINWKCLDCDVLLCDRCKTIHSKVKTQLVHSIIDVKEIRAEATSRETKVELKAVRCSNHRQQVCCIYCRDCKQLACPSCLSQTHKKHELEDLDTIYNEQIEVLKHFHSKFSIEILNKNINDEQMLQQAKTSHKNQIEATKQEIKDRDKVLHDQFTKQTNKLISDTDKRMQVVETTISQEISSLMTTRTYVEDKARLLVECMESGDIERVLNMVTTAEEAHAQINQRKVNIPMESLTLVSRPLQADNISAIFGSLQNATIPKQTVKNKEANFELIKTFKTTWTLITTILPCEDESFYMYATVDDGKCVIVKVHINNEITTTILREEIGVDGMAIGKNKRLLVTLADDSKIYYLFENGTLKQLKDMSPKLPLALYYTMDQSILVSTHDQNNHCQLHKLGQDGRVINTIEFDYNHRRLFTTIGRITTDVKDNIYVVDLDLDNCKGRIISMDKDGGLRWIYKGDTKINIDRNFFPADMVQTSLQNWIMYDANNHMLHILNSDRRLITFQDMEELNIEMPIISMAMTNKGQIVLGCCLTPEQKERNMKTTIHILKLSGI